MEPKLMICPEKNDTKCHSCPHEDIHEYLSRCMEICSGGKCREATIEELVLFRIDGKEIFRPWKIDSL
jgi:hypothetical protein